jgi:CIC family chloride channel protein
MLGGAFGTGANHLFPTITAPTGAYALVGMGAFFGAAVGGPITAIIIVFEITRDYLVILPLIIAVAFSTIIFSRFTGETIYTMRLLKRGVTVSKFDESDMMRGVTVGEMMKQDFPTVSTEMPVTQLIRMLEKTGHHGFPVLNKDGSLYGIVTLSDVESGLRSGTPHLKVSDIATKNPMTAYPDQSIPDVMNKLGVMEVGRIPVVARDDPTKLLGVLSRRDIIRAYQKAIKASRKRGLT